MASLDLLSNMNYVETPFIIAEIEGVSFGVYNVRNENIIQGNKAYSALSVTYPNFMKSLSVTKINGLVNTYNLNMVYPIRNGDDPNLLEKIFSKAKKTRTIYLSYGDLSLPNYIYKKEEVLLLDIKRDVDFDNAKINYTLQCQSKSLLSNVTKYNFPLRTAKASDVIKEMLYKNDAKYHLLDIFYGMRDKQKVLSNSLIASDDIVTTIQAQNNMSALDYLQYLVKCMMPTAQSDNTVVKQSTYRINCIDDVSGVYQGPYFKVTKLSTNILKDTLDVYTINVGYPDKNVVLNFNIEDNQVFSIFHEYAGDINSPSYIQRIDKDGNLINEYSPAYSNTRNLLKTTAADKNWWTNVVNYPINATLKIKGLIRPAILMTYIYINARFYGKKYNASGYYVITKQVDDISSSGYRTTLTLTRVSGDNEIDN